MREAILVLVHPIQFNMCGIFGLYSIDRKDEKPSADLFLRSLLTMKHRGPDSHAVKSFPEGVLLGHLRLSIIDLNEASNQPMEIDSRYWIIFNGEIYNYIEIREELISEGYHFHTNGDTEVLLRAYQRWGKSCVQKFNGMWAFAIYDLHTHELFCSRDRFGVKPFVYSVISGQFLFASEVKPLISYYPQLKRPNYNAIANFCRTSVGAQHSETWFEDIFRLPPGHSLSVLNGKIELQRYWSYPIKSDSTISFPDAVTKYKELFEDAVKLRMRSDVPVGTTLSSGLDSTSIVSCLREFNLSNHHTFTATFDSKGYTAKEKEVYADKSLTIDEASIVRRLSEQFNLSSRFINIDYSSFVDQVRNIVYYLESGNSSPAVVPLMQILKEARKEVTVVLEGQGADELLAGYVLNNIYPALWDTIRRFKLRAAYRLARQFSKYYSLGYAFKMLVRNQINRWPTIYKSYARLSGLDKLFVGPLHKYKFKKDYPDAADLAFDDMVNKNLAQQHSGGLVNLLHYGDAISMANSLESRLPFMDYRLVEFSFSLPWQFKIREAYGKFIHREAMKGVVPDFILNNAIKFGFSTPVSQFFKEGTELKERPVDILLSDRCLSRGLFNKKQLLKIIEQHNSGKHNHGLLLYRLLVVELWFQQFVD